MVELNGQQVGNYRLQEFLGRGGFAEVYRGEHIYLGSHAAIKILHTRLTGNEHASFIQEARVLTRLIHPHIVRILEFGIEREQNQAYLIMDYAPNGTLRQRHTSMNAAKQSVATIVPLPSVIEYVKQIASALQYAHEQRCVHRDLKPDNILIDRNNSLLVSDFGLARTYHSTFQSVEGLQSKGISGTVPYMAPEQFEGKVQYASDQYSLGVMVYEWLSGSLPVNGNFWEVLGQHFHSTEAPSLCALNPSIPVVIEQVVLKALAKNPQNRFPTILAFAQALEQALHSKPLNIRQQALVPDMVLPANNGAVLLQFAEEASYEQLTFPSLSFVKDPQGGQLSFPSSPVSEDPQEGQLSFPSLPFAEAQSVSTSMSVPLNDIASFQSQQEQTIVPPSVTTPSSGNTTELFIMPDQAPRRVRKPFVYALIAIVISLTLAGTGSAIAFFHPFSNNGSQKQVVLEASPTSTVTATPVAKGKSTPHATHTSAPAPIPTPTQVLQPQPTSPPAPAQVLQPQPTSPPAPVSQPTATPTPQMPSTVSYEAESPSNTWIGDLQEFSCSLCSGGERIGWIEGSTALQFNGVTASYTGNDTLLIYYYNSIPNRTTELYVSVDGGTNVEVTGLQVSTVNCCTYPPEVVSMTITLQAGQNTIKLSNPNGPAPDIDRIVVES
jgi:serine/threonine protein kinase